MMTNYKVSFGREYHYHIDSSPGSDATPDKAPEARKGSLTRRLSESLSAYSPLRGSAGRRSSK